MSNIIQTYSETPTTSTITTPTTTTPTKLLNLPIKLSYNNKLNNSLNYYQNNNCNKNFIIKTSQTINHLTKSNNLIPINSVPINYEKEKKKMLVFSILLITNLLIIVCLLFIWNIKGVNNVRILK